MVYKMIKMVYKMIKKFTEIRKFKINLQLFKK